MASKPKASLSNIRGMLAADVKGDLPKKLQWPDAVDPIFYEGSVNCIAGPSDMGKSTTVIRLVADLSKQGMTIIYGNREDAAAVQAMRLAAAGADMTKVRLASYIIPDELELLEEAIWATSAKMYVMDTALKHINAPVNRNAKPLMALGDVCERTKCAAMLVHHTLKNVRANADWRAAIGGPTDGIQGTARAISLFGVRPDNAAQRVLCPVKDNYGEKPAALAMEFDTEEFDQEDGPPVEIAYVNISERQLTIANPTALVVVQGQGDGKRGPKPEALRDAAAFLTETLANGPLSVKDCYLCLTNPDGIAPDGSKLKDPEDPKRKCGHKTVKDVQSAKDVCPDCGGPVQAVEGIHSRAEGAEVTAGTLKKTLPHLGVITARKGFGSGGMWFWRLPDGHPKLAPNAPKVWS